MSEKLKVIPSVLQKMGSDWSIKVNESPFTPGKGANLPSLGYPCASCAGDDTKLRFAKSTEVAESTLEWMELICKSCGNYTLYTKK